MPNKKFCSSPEGDQLNSLEIIVVSKDKLVDYYVLDNHVLAVAIEGEVKDWAAYIGDMKGYNLDWDIEMVKRNGTKLPEKIARILFPNFKNLRWRS